MGMDGLYRPSQALGYTDSLGTLNGTDRLARANAQAGEIHRGEAVAEVRRQKNADPDSRQRRQRRAPDAPDVEIAPDWRKILAEQYQIVFEPGIAYRFIYDETLDKILLKDITRDRIVLTLPPADFIQVSEHISAQAGIMTDRSG